MHEQSRDQQGGQRVTLLGNALGAQVLERGLHGLSQGLLASAQVLHGS